MEKLKENQEIDIENLKFENDENLEKELLEKYDIKLDSDESVFFKFTCSSRLISMLKIAVYALFLYFIVIVFLNERLFLQICAGLSFLIFLAIIYHEIMNFINQGFYVTNKNLITFGGKKISLDNVYFLCKSSEFFTFIGFYNKNLYIQDCYCNKSDEFSNFINSLYFISHNEYILQFAWDNKSQQKAKFDRINKIKLINN